DNIPTACLIIVTVRIFSHVHQHNRHSGIPKFAPNPVPLKVCTRGRGTLLSERPHGLNPSASIRTSGESFAIISNTISVGLVTGVGLEPTLPACTGALTVKLPCNLS